MATIDVECVDTRKGWKDPAMTGHRLLSIGEVEIVGILDMVKKLEQKCSGGDRLGELTIQAHGSAEGQWIGYDFINGVNVCEYREEFGRLRPLFAKEGGRLTLGGCFVGLETQLMKKLSDMLWVPVRAFRARQNSLSPVWLGTEVQCYITCTSGRQGLADYIP